MLCVLYTISYLLHIGSKGKPSCKRFRKSCRISTSVWNFSWLLYDMTDAICRQSFFAKLNLSKWLRTLGLCFWLILLTVVEVDRLGLLWNLSFRWALYDSLLYLGDTRLLSNRSSPCFLRIVMICLQGKHVALAKQQEHDASVVTTSPADDWKVNGLDLELLSLTVCSAECCLSTIWYA